MFICNKFFRKFKALFLYITIISSSALAMNDKYESFVEIIPDKVYTARSYATSGEPIYFGLEKIDEVNEKSWRRYVDYTRYLNSDWGLLRHIALKHDVPNFDSSGMSNDEFKDFLLRFKNRCMQESFVKCLKGISAGAAHCFVLPDVYLAYVSKTPITGIFIHPDTEGPQLSLKTYLDAYKDLLMVVGSHNRKGSLNFPYYENRGIFRNPASLLNDEGYKGISLKLHGFTALFWKQYFNKKLMFVSALEKMCEILFSKFTQKELFKHPLPVQLQEMEGFLQSKGMEEEPCFIDIEALIKGFRE